MVAKIYWIAEILAKVAKKEHTKISIYRLTVTYFCFIRMPAVFRYHVVSKTPRNVCYCDIAEICFVRMIIWAFS